jgi:hypothetical protein
LDLCLNAHYPEHSSQTADDFRQTLADKELEAFRDVLCPAASSDGPAASHVIPDRVRLNPEKFILVAKTSGGDGKKEFPQYHPVAAWPKERPLNQGKFAVMGTRGVLQACVVEALKKLESCSRGSKLVAILDKPSPQVFALTGTSHYSLNYLCLGLGKAIADKRVIVNK